MSSAEPPRYASVINTPTTNIPACPFGQQAIGQHSNASAYTLATIPKNIGSPSSRSISMASLRTDETDRLRLIDTRLPASSYGTTPAIPNNNGNVSSRRLLLNAGIKMAALFVISSVILGGTLWLTLPRLEEQDRPLLRVPKSFEQLKELNYLLKKYRDIYPARIVVCYITTYLFLQAFSLPGSMYLSILGGAVWGVSIALPLACTCVATGATLCYLISAALGPAIIALPKWAARLERWSVVLNAQRANLISYLIVLRIAPFPPHWVINVLAPHLRIGIPAFWISTFLGILGVTVIHTTIGNGLDDMTSAADFHLISWKNVLGLCAVVVGVLIPVGLRFVLSRRVGGAIALSDDDEGVEGEQDAIGSLTATANGSLGIAISDVDTILAQSPLVVNKGKTAQLILLSDSEDEDDYIGDNDENRMKESGETGEDDILEEEEDEILETGPAMVPLPTKGKGIIAALRDGSVSPHGFGQGFRVARRASSSSLPPPPELLE